MSLPDSATLIAAARLAWAAYNDPELSLNYDARTMDSLLGESGLSNWSALTAPSFGTAGPPEFGSLPKSMFVAGGPFGGAHYTDGIDQRGYYVAGNDAAYVAKSTDGTLSLVFRGADNALLPDYFDAWTGAENSYKALAPLISAFIAYANNPANGVTKILVAGHSLGGELATLFATDFINGTKNIADLDSTRFPQSKIDVVTFGSPGIPPAQHRTALWDSRILNIHHSDDIVFNHQGPAAVISGFIHPGNNLAIDLPTVFGTDFLPPPPFLGGTSAIINAAEHRMTNYAFSVAGGLRGLGPRGHDGVAVSPGYEYALNASNFIVEDDSVNIVLENSSSSNFILGFAGDDWITGGSNNDVIDGGIGKDLLVGGLGDDRLFGGAGRDTYRFHAGDGNDTIDEAGGNVGELDTVQVYGDTRITSLSQISYRLTNNSHDLVIELDGSAQGSMSIRNMDAPGSQVEKLQLNDIFGTEIGSDVDLVAKFNSLRAPPPTIGPPPNTAPHVDGANLLPLAAQTTFLASVLFRGYDPDNDRVVSYSINDATGSGYFQLGGTPKPEGTAFTVTAEDFANLRYVVGSAGTADVFTVRAADSQRPNGGAASTFTVLSQNPASVPTPNVYTANDDTRTTTSGHPIVIDALTNDDPHLVKITSLSGQDSQFVAIKPGTQDAIIVAPPSGFVGAYHFSYTATDGYGASATAQVTVNITPYTPTPTAPVDTNHPPVAPDLHQTINTGQQENVAPLLFSYDVDSDDQGAVLTLVGYGSAGHGTIARNGGTLTYTPDAGFIGDDHFSYTIQDTHAAQATGTITVTINQPPTIQPDFVATNPDTPVTFNVLQNDLYTGTGHLSLQSTGFGPQHGSVTFDNSGQITYMPAAGYTGIDSFTYYALDNVGGQGNAQVVVAVGSSAVQQGGDGDDVLVGTSGADLLQGNGGNDTLNGGAGNDILDGGSGFNYADFSGATGPTYINLTPPAVAGDGTVRWDQVLSNDGRGGQDSLRNIQGIIGSDQQDTVQCGASDNIVYANGGDDSVILGRGNDTIYGGDGNDRIDSQGLSANYTAYGGSGNDTISVGSGNDYIDGGGGNDQLYGGGGQDTIIGGAGDDSLSGSGTLDGGSGNDTLRANFGTATLIGGEGDDLLVAGSLDIDSHNNDVLLGGDGNDTLVANRGNDTLDGGVGTDTVQFDLSAAPVESVVIDLAAGFAQSGTSFYTLRSIEGVHARDFNGGTVYGSQADDTLFGDFYSGGTLVGRGGDDVIGAGNHLGGGEVVIEGDAGADALTGGMGHTRFLYKNILDGADVITDFTPGTGADSDVLDFGDLLASAGYTGATPIADGYLRFVASGNDTIFQIDLDGPGAGAQFETLATLQGVARSSLVAANFASPVDIGATSPATGPIASDWSQSLSYRKGQSSVALGSMAVGPDPNVQLTVQLVLADPTIGALAAANGATYDPVTGTWLMSGTEAQVNAALAGISFVPYAGREADSTISTFVSDGTNAPVGGLITLTLQNTPTIINGTDGDDVLVAQTGDNLIFGGLGNNEVDYRYSGAVGIRVDLSQGSGTDANGRLDKLFDVEAARGTDFNDLLIGDNVVNQLTGLDGNDTLQGGAGADVLDGGDGFDFASYASAPTGVTADLADQTQNTGDAAGDSYVSIDGLVGSSFDDALTGDGNPNTLSGGSGNDTLRGGDSDDILIGGPGVDLLDGGNGADAASYENAAAAVNASLATPGANTGEAAGDTYASIENLSGSAHDDTLTGDDGSNALDGGAGNDTLSGLGGNDVYAVDSVGDVVNEAVGGGTDMVLASVNYALKSGSEVEMLSTDSADGTGAIDLTGNEFANAIFGNAGANRLDGKGGADTMTGFGGDDYYIVETAADLVREAVGGGSDLVFASVNYSLSAGQEIERLQTSNTSGTDAINLTGNEFANAIYGNAGTNLLDGRGGADTMGGFGGNDYYHVDNPGDVIREAVGGGFDQVFASASYILTAKQEIERLQTRNTSGTDAINLTGNELANAIYGNAGINVLDGKGGADTMTGFGGNDHYYVDNAGDSVRESAGGGADTVFASVSYALTARQDIERLQTTSTSGTGAINLTGNDLANSIYGNAGKNVINGGAGNDLLTGFGGNDTFLFNTALNAATNVDRIADFSVPADTIELAHAIFTTLAVGALAPTAFFIGAGAHDADDRVIYNASTGALIYDTNGSAAGGATQFATLHTGLALTRADFKIV